MTVKDTAINGILTLMELSAQLQTESLAKSEASLHAAEQAGWVCDVVGINWEIEIEPLLGWRHTASGLTAEPESRGCLPNGGGLVGRPKIASDG